MRGTLSGMGRLGSQRNTGIGWTVLERRVSEMVSIRARSTR